MDLDLERSEHNLKNIRLELDAIEFELAKTSDVFEQLALCEALGLVKQELQRANFIHHELLESKFYSIVNH